MRCHRDATESGLLLMLSAMLTFQSLKLSGGSCH